MTMDPAMTHTIPATLTLFRLPLLVLCAGLAHGEDSESPRPWHLSLGLGASIGPEYPGSDTVVVAPVPLIDARWGHAILDTARLGAPFLGGRFAGWSDQFVVHLGAAYLGGRDSSDDDRLAGQPDIDPTLVAAVTAEWTPGHGPFLLRGLATQDLLDEGHGATALAQVLLRAPPSAHLRIQGGIGALWADQTFMDTWFGTFAGTSASPDAAYEPDAGVREVHAIIETRILIHGAWSLVGRVTAGSLVGDADDSPLTQSSTFVRSTAGVIYTF
jgi:outer membrane protein